MSDERILIVEDEAIVAKSIEAKLTRLGYHVLGTVYSGTDAIDMALESKPSLVLMDVRLRGKLDGVQAAQAIRSQLDVPIVYLTALPNEQRFRPFAYLGKPFTTAELHRAIQRAIGKHE